MVLSGSRFRSTPIWFGFMGRTREGELSTSTAAVLGFVIEEPDNAKGLEERLQKRFVAARWSHSAAHSALRSLETNGYVRPIIASRRTAVPASNDVADTSWHARPDVSALLSRTRGQLRPQSSRSLEGTLFEATLQGTKVFWRWQRQASEPDALRDELRMKIAFSRPEHIPRLIELIEEEERYYEREYERLHKSIGPLEDGIADDAFVTAQDWSALMSIGLLRDEMAIWLAKQRQRERLREYLEGLRDEAARRASGLRSQGR